MSTSPSARSYRLRLARDEVLAAVRAGDGVTRGEIQRAVRLPRAVVEASAEALLLARLIEETPAAAGSGRGRPGRRLTATVPAHTVVGVDLGHGHIAAAVADTRLSVLAEERVEFEVDQDAAGALDTAADLVHRVLVRSGVEAGRAPTTCAVGVPGPLDRGGRTVSSPTVLRAWGGVDIVEAFAARTGLRVVTDNDANLGALAEHHSGAAVGCDDFLYVRASNGVGAGVFVDGRVVRGTAGGAGEIGHTQLRQDGDWCRCGNRGCLETVVSIRQLRQVARLRPGGAAGTGVDVDVTTDPVARKVLAETGRTLGVVLANLCALLDPAALVIGGELAELAEDFVDGLRESVHRLAQPRREGSVRVVRAVHGTRAELVGALVAAREAVLEAAVPA